MRDVLRFAVAGLLLLGCQADRAARGTDATLPRASYGSVRIEEVVDLTGAQLSGHILDAVRDGIGNTLAANGFVLAGWTHAPAPVVQLKSELLSCEPLYRRGRPPASGTTCVAAVAAVDLETAHVIIESALKIPVPAQAIQADRAGMQADVIPLLAQALGEEFARQLRADRAAAPAAAAGEDITHSGLPVRHLGDGTFLVGTAPPSTDLRFPAETFDLGRIRHAHDQRVDPDVPVFTNTTLNDIVPPLTDADGRDYAVITLYQIDPPLADLPSRDPGIERGMDFRDPANLVKSAYSNYVSPVLTYDVDRLHVSGHPIGHFYVKVEVPGFPTVLTGMTTIKRADTELQDLTFGRQLGIGGVLLTPEPGRLNSAAEVLRELTLRQRRLRVVDGVHYHNVGGRNVGPQFTITDGNVVFARFKIPLRNGKDALAFFAEYLRRGTHSIFGSLISRPNKATGAGCTPFAMAWLEASGVIPFVSEPRVAPQDTPLPAERYDDRDFWRYLLRSIDIPWSHIGCDDRLGAGGIVEADYTVYDLLFYREDPKLIVAASEGLAEKIREDYGFLSGTLFQMGALTPLRDLAVNGKRKDPGDHGNYGWAAGADGLETEFWDNARFSSWVKQLWATGPNSPAITLAREGRFLGIEVDAMQAARQAEPFFTAADEILEKRRAFELSGRRPASCREVFALGLQ